MTAGNSCGISDGAAGVILCSGVKVLEHGIKPLAKVIATAQIGIDALDLGLGPLNAIRKVVGTFMLHAVLF